MRTLMLATGLWILGTSLFAEETLDVTITPEKPFLLPDGKTKLTVKSDAIYLGRGGRTGAVQVHLGETILPLVSRMVIHAGEYRYVFKDALTFEFGEKMQEDMIFTLVKSCTFAVRSSKEEAPLIPLKKVEETIEVETPHGQIHSDLYTIQGEGGHFLSLKPSSAEISRFHPDPELGARLRLDVVTAFGAKSITLNYKKPQEFEIGPEKIILESSGFDYEKRVLKVKVTVVPTGSEARPAIVEYGN